MTDTANVRHLDDERRKRDVELFTLPDAVTDEPDTVEETPDQESDEVDTASLFNLPSTFWDERPTLAHIRDAALSRTCSPDAVLGHVLALVVAAHPPALRLDNRGGSLNLIVALVAPSGVGKSEAMACAGELVPLDHRTDLEVDIPIGSGEGIAATYLGESKKIDGKEVREIVTPAAMFVADEGQMIADLGNRSGSTLLPVLRSAWSGKTIGARNAGTNTNRKVPGGRYRFAFVFGIQPGNAGGLFDDAGAGTPQRIVWMPATYPPIVELDTLPAWPGPLDLPTPTVSTGEAMTYAAEIERELVELNKRALAGLSERSELDSQRDVQRKKIAAALALLEERRHVTDDDWRLAGQVLRTSDVTRAGIVETLAAVQQERNAGRIRRKQNETEAIAETVERRALEGGARAIARKVHRDGQLDHREATHAVKGEWRKLAHVDDMIARAVELEWIVEHADDGKRTYLPGGSHPT